MLPLVARIILALFSYILHFMREKSNDKAKNLKYLLQRLISAMAGDPSSFVVNPGADFTRKRKLDFATLINLILSMRGNSISKELLDHFEPQDLMTASAFVQQRDKLLPDAFEHLFHEFNRACSDDLTYEGYHLLAVDGSDINIPKNPDSDTYFEQGFNQFHINALYDLLNKTYTDVVIQPSPKEQEERAAVEMIGRLSLPYKSILIADRGYESVNLVEHIRRTPNLDFLIRVKNAGTRETRTLPMCDLDIDISFELRTTQRKEDKEAFASGRAKYIAGKSKFGKDRYTAWDFESPFRMTYRVVRFKITEDTYETVITSLDRDTFPPEKIKKLYGMRWGIETSFRELKYAIGAINFHAKKEAFIIQEIFASLIMYNFCERITISVVISQKDSRKHTYQVNFTMAIHICRDFFSSNRPPPDITSLIKRYILPVREGRADKRKMRAQKVITFIYRVA